MQATTLALMILVSWAGWQPDAPKQPEAPKQPSGPPSAPAKDQPRPPARPPARDPLGWPMLPASPQVQRVEATPAEKVKVDDRTIDLAVKRSVDLLLTMQEGLENSEWPYEGVYRVGGQIPVGYRVGGTAIVAMSLLEAPGYAEDGRRRAAVERAAKFVCGAIEHPLMSPDTYQGGYDVRVWGHIYGLHLLVELKKRGAIPKPLAEPAERAIAYYLQGLKKLEITPGTPGGWNYASEKTAAPFVTGPALMALFAARAQGYAVDDGLVARGLDSLERSRGAQGTVVYSGAAGARSGQGDSVPGAMGRMCVTESVLLLAGRGGVERVRNAVDKFIEHWAEFDKRRTMTGTHVPPYMVAPYYFMYGHRYAALAVELLPEAERAGYRERLNRLMFSVRSEDGSWTDRVFKRTANFGTAFALHALLAPAVGKPAGWAPPKAPAGAPAPGDKGAAG